MVGTRHILGLAIDECGVVATELSVRAGRTEMRGAAEFPWEKEFTADNARELGQSLRRFLREKGFTAKRAAVGLAAKWVLAKEVEAPPATSEALAGILGIQAERVFSMNPGDLVFDYCGKTSPSQKSQVLLLAARRQVVDQIRELAAAAGLQIESITVSAFACGSSSTENRMGSRYGLYARPTYCEFWGQLDGSPRFIKHIPMVLNGDASGSADLLSGTIRRLLLLSSQQDQSSSRQVTAYDACGLAPEVFDRLNERLAPHVQVRNGRLGMLPDGAAGSGDPKESRAVAAAAVARTAVAAQRPTIDFLNPRIGRKKKADPRRAAVWGAAVAGVCLIALAVWLFGWRADASDIATYKEQLAALEEDLAAAQAVVDRLSYADSWGSTDPRFLSCLRELTQAFPEEGDVWVTSLAVTEAGAGLIVGRATNDQSVYEVCDKIKSNPAFADAQLIHTRDAGRNSREREFAINFTYKGTK